MARTSNSLDSSEGSHFSGRPPPPYHLVDVTKQFSFNYATTVDRDTASKDVDTKSSERVPAPFAGERSDAIACAFSTADSEAPAVVLRSLRGITVDRTTALSVFSSEDGGVLLPPSSTLSSTATIPTTQLLEEITRLRKLALAPESFISSPTYELPANNVVGRSSTASAPARARIQANVIARAQSAATDHQQYASYRRQYDRSRNILGSPLPEEISYSEFDCLTSSDFDRCSEPWALSSVASWLKDVLPTSLAYLTNITLLHALERLFHYKLGAENIRIYPSLLSCRVLEAMIASGALIPNIPGGHIFQYGSGITTGVLVELTGGGCYTPTPHYIVDGCYSPRCISNDHLEEPANSVGLKPREIF